MALPRVIPPKIDDFDHVTRISCLGPVKWWWTCTCGKSKGSKAEPAFTSGARAYGDAVYHERTGR